MALGDLMMIVSESGTALGQVLDSGQRCPPEVAVCGLLS